MKNERIINIINYFRSEDWRYADTLHSTAVNLLEICKRYSMPCTFLLLYDAMIKPEYSELFLKDPDPNIEVGLWLELSKEAVERAGLKWKEEHNWTWHVNPGMVLGYDAEAREKIIDELMGRFKSVFGKYPDSVGSWIIDTHTVNYLKDRYDVKAICICREQYGTDGYTLWGGYYNQGYYPSRNNMFMPAQTKEQQVNVPIFRMLGPDPIYQYDCTLDRNFNVDKNKCDVVTLEPYYTESGGNENWVNWYLNSVFSSEALSFSYLQAGQENSFPWSTVEKGLEIQMKMIYDGFKNGKWRVEKLGDTGRWFSENFKSTPAAAMTALDDPHNNGNQTVWYNCKNYRMNLHNREGKICIRDMFLFDEGYSDRYLTEPAPGDSAVFNTLPVIDGFCWSGNNIHSAMYFVRRGSYEKADGRILSVKSENGNELRIVFELDGKKTVCVCREGRVCFDFTDNSFDLLFRYNSLKDTVIKEIGKSAVKYGYETAEYGIKLNGTAAPEENGYRISPAADRLEISFFRGKEL